MLRLKRRAQSLNRNPSSGTDRYFGFMLLSPLVVGLAAFVFVPLGVAVLYSFQDIHSLAGNAGFAGLDNYIQMVRDPGFKQSLVNSFIFVVLFVPLNIGLGLFLAIMLNGAIKWRAFFRTIIFMPVAISLAAWSVVWKAVLQNDGIVNALLSLLGVGGPNWLNDTRTAMIAMVVVVLFKEAGLTMLIFLAGLQSLPRELTDAAAVDGAGSWAQFRWVTLPLMSPLIFLLAINSTIGSFKIIESVRILTEGGPQGSTSVLVWFVYVQAFRLFRVGYGSAIAVTLFVIVLVITISMWVVRKRVVYAES